MATSEQASQCGEQSVRSRPDREEGDPIDVPARGEDSGEDADHDEGESPGERAPNK